MSTDGGSKDDVKVPEGEMGQQIQAGFDEGKDLLVTIIGSMGEEQVCFLLMSLVAPVVFTLFRPSPSRRHRKAVNRHRICSRNLRSYNLARLEDIDNCYLVIGWCYSNCSPCHILVYIRPRLHSLFHFVTSYLNCCCTQIFIEESNEITKIRRTNCIVNIILFLSGCFTACDRSY